MKAKTEAVIVPLGNEFKSIFETACEFYRSLYYCHVVRSTFFLFSFLSMQRNRTEKASALQNFYFKLKPDHTRAVCGLNVSMDLVIFHLSFLWYTKPQVWISLLCLGGTTLWIKICGLNLAGNETICSREEGGAHEALPVLRPNSKERNTWCDWAGVGRYS